MADLRQKTIAIDWRGRRSSFEKGEGDLKTQIDSIDAFLASNKLDDFHMEDEQLSGLYIPNVAAADNPRLKGFFFDGVEGAAAFDAKVNAWLATIDNATKQIKARRFSEELALFLYEPNP